MNSLSKLPSDALLGAISIYQKTRFLRPPSCRFYPCCSEYMAQGVKRFGVSGGVLLGLVRLCKCHPFHNGGVDEVPENFPPMSQQLGLIGFKRSLKKIFQSKISSPEVASEH